MRASPAAGLLLAAFVVAARDDALLPRPDEVHLRNLRQLTFAGENAEGYFAPDGRRIIVASNHPDPRGRNFDTWMVRDDGEGLERVTTDPTFDGIPMFSADDRRLVFASNRGAAVRGETNLFIADWVE